MTALGIDIDLRPDYLEDHWGDECKCENTHKEKDNKVCSVVVVARGRSCADSVLMCQNAVVQKLRQMSTGWTCGKCQRLARECWSVIPV